jgi:hypothetical protein
MESTSGPLLETKRAHPRRHWKHIVGATSQDRSGQLRRHLREARVGEPHGKHEGPDGTGRDYAGREGRLRPGDTVVEYSGGSTGASIALVCGTKGYSLRIVTSDAFSQEKRDHMAALGAELIVILSEGGLTTKELILEMIEAARQLSQQPHTFWFDQLNNQSRLASRRAWITSCAITLIT